MLYYQYKTWLFCLIIIRSAHQLHSMRAEFSPRVGAESGTDTSGPGPAGCVYSRAQRYKRIFEGSFLHFDFYGSTIKFQNVIVSSNFVHLQ